MRFGVRITSLREVSGPPLGEHGVLAPNAKQRSLVVPQGPPKDEEAARVAASGVQCAAETAQVRAGRISWPRLLKRVLATT